MKRKNNNEPELQIQNKDTDEIAGRNDEDINADTYYEMYEDDRL